MGPRHTVELGDPGDHPALAGREQQRPVAALPLVEALQVVVGLAAAHPVPGLGGRRVGGHGRSLDQEASIAVDRLGRGLGGGPGQRRGVLTGEAPRRKRLGNVGHLLEGLGPPGAMLGLAGRAAGSLAQCLGGAGLAGTESSQPGRDPGLQTVEHGPGETDPSGEVSEPGPVQGGYVDGLHGGVEVVPHGGHGGHGGRPECSDPD